jgi:hypothetical protein
MITTPFKLRQAFPLITLLFMQASYAEPVKQQVITNDGREVLLNEDGTWKYLSNDRYADTVDGRRVRLKEDGSWEYVGNAPAKSMDQVRTTDLDIKLKKVVIENFQKKVQKNTHLTTQTVFYVTLAHSPQAKTGISISQDDIAFISVKDNNGKSDPVVSMKADTTRLEPDAEASIVIRAEKSPSIWDDVKSMQVVFDKGIFGIEAPITLSMRVIDFQEEDVDGFD